MYEPLPGRKHKTKLKAQTTTTCWLKECVTPIYIKVLIWTNLKRTSVKTGVVFTCFLFSLFFFFCSICEKIKKILTKTNMIMLLTTLESSFKEITSVLLFVCFFPGLSPGTFKMSKNKIVSEQHLVRPIKYHIYLIYRLDMRMCEDLTSLFILFIISDIKRN